MMKTTRKIGWLSVLIVSVLCMLGAFLFTLSHGGGSPTLTPPPQQPTTSSVEVNANLSKPTLMVQRSYGSTSTLKATNPPITQTPIPSVSTGFSKCSNIPKVSQTNVEVPGVLLFWNASGPMYGALIPSFSYPMDLQEIKPLESNTPGPGTDPLNDTIAFAFAEGEKRIAYFVENPDGIVELWVSDLYLCKAEKLWVDTSQRLIDAHRPFSNKGVRLSWGVGNKHLVLTSHIDVLRTLIYDLSANQETLFDGECNLFLRSSEHWSQVCHRSEGRGSQHPDHQMFDLNGNIVQIDGLSPENLITATEWALSPDRQRLVYLTEQNEYRIADLSGFSLRLPLSIDSTSIFQMQADAYSKLFFWSQDGTKMLAFGSPNAKELCPPLISLITGEKVDQACWVLLDSSKGDILWQLKKVVAEKTIGQWEGLYTAYPAMISPDNEWVAISVFFNSLRYFLIVSTRDDQIYVKDYYPVDFLYWDIPQ